MNVIYTRKNYKIYKVNKGEFIVHNTNKSFNQGHTHINNFNTAKYLISMSLNSLVPKKKLSNYLLESIQRISTDKLYIIKIENLKR